MADIIDIGDIVTLQSDKGTFLSVDITNQLQWETPENGLNSPLNFDRCLWKVVERLSYVDQEMAAMLRRKNSIDGHESMIIVEQAEREAERNIAELEHSLGSQLLYGRTVQFQHVMTGQFLTARNNAAPIDRDCLGLVISSGSSSCYFRIQPKYKIRSEGGQVMGEDEVMISSVASNGYFVHESKNYLGPLKSKEGINFNEANLSRSTLGSSIALSIHSKHHKPQYNDFLQCGKPFRFFDREQDGFLQCSCSTRFEKAKSMFPDISGRVTNPQHPDFFSAKGVWSMERVNRISGGFVGWNTEEYRIKHLPTQRYLTVGRKNMIKQKKRRLMINFSGDDAERKYRLTLEWDSNDEKMKARQVFRFKPVDLSGEYVPKNDAMVILTHTMPNGKEIHYHSNEDRTVCMSTLLRSYDALMLMSVDAQPEQDIRYISSAVSVLKSYVANLNEQKFPSHSSELDVECKVLSSIIRNSLIGDGKSESDALTIEGQPRPVFQNIARELRLIECLLDVVVAPINANIDLSFGNNSSEDGIQTWADKRFIPLETLHKLAWRALMFIVRSNSVSEMYLIGLKVKCDPKIDDESANNPFMRMFSLFGSAVSQGTSLGMSISKAISKTLGKTVKFAVGTTMGTLGTTLGTLNSLQKMAVSNIPVPGDVQLGLPGVDLNIPGMDLSLPGGLGDMSIGLPGDMSLGLPMDLPGVDMGGLNPMDGLSGLGVDLPTSIPGVDLGVGNLMDMNVDMDDLLDDFPVDFSDLPGIPGMGGMIPGMPWEEEGFDDAVPMDDPPIPEEEIEKFTAAINIIVAQVPNPVGAAQLLTALIENNPVLLTKVVDKQMIDYFKDLIRNEGPSARFMSFFQAICSCRGQPIPKNQELGLAELIENQEDYDFLFIRVYTIDYTTSSTPWEWCSGVQSQLAANQEVSIYGKDVIANGLPSVFVSWKGHSEWKAKSQALFWSPKSLNIPTIDRHHVRLEDLCWVLDPEVLCEKVTGTSWTTMQETMKGSEALKSRFQDHITFASYFESQIDVLAEMVRGRAYSVIFSIEKLYSYPLLVSAIANPLLPYTIRSRFVKLLKRLYIERFPHEENCARSSIPNFVWIFSQLRDLTIDDDLALPRFRLWDKSMLRQNPDPFYNIATSQKFALVTSFSISFMSSIESQIAEYRGLNRCINEIISMIGSLLNYGFFSSADHIADIAKPLMAVLDGRSDAMTGQHESNAVVVHIPSAKSSNKKSKMVPFGISGGDGGDGDDYAADDNENQSEVSNERPHNPDMPIDSVQRYKVDDNTIVIMETKRNIASVLMTISSFRNQFRIAKFLNIFKECVESSSPLQPETITAIVEDNNVDASKLNFAKLCDGRSFEGVVIDLLQYHDQDMFESIFRLLIAEKSNIQTLLSLGKKVVMLENQQVPEFITFDELDRYSSDISRIMESADTWGIDYNNPECAQNYDLFWEIIDILIPYLKRTDFPNHQRLILLLDIHKSLMRPFRWDFSDGRLFAAKQDKSAAGKGSKAKAAVEDANAPPDRHNLRAVVNACVEALGLIVLNNPSIRQEMSRNGFDRTLISQTAHFPKVLGVVAEMYKGDKDVVLRSPLYLFGHYGTILGNPEAENRQIGLRFFFDQLLPENAEGEPIPKNQYLVIRSIIDAIRNKVFVFDITAVSSAQQLSEYIDVMDILSLCCHNNADIGSKMVQSILQWETAADRLCKLIDCDVSQDAGLGLSIAGLNPDKDNIQALRFKWIAISLKFLRFLNLDNKISDERVVNSPMMSQVVTSVCQALVKEDFVSRKADAKSADINERANQVVEKFLFLNAFISTETCSDLHLLALIQNTAVRVNNIVAGRDGSVQSDLSDNSRVIDAVSDVIEKLVPSEVIVRERDNIQLHKRKGAKKHLEVDTLRNNDEFYTFQGLDEQFKGFLSSAESNLEDVIHQEKLSVLHILLRANELTNPNNLEYVNSNSKEGRTNTVTWRDMTTRMIHYIDYKLLRKKDEGIIVNILELWTLYLRETEENGMGDEVLKTRQNDLNEAGVTQLVYRLLCEYSSGAIFMGSISLLIALVEKSNHNCQETLYKYMHGYDLDGKFFSNFKQVLVKFFDWSLESRFDPNVVIPSHMIEIIPEKHEALRVLQFLATICTNNNHWQNAIRDQSSFKRQSQNIIENIANIVDAIAPRRDVFRHLRVFHADILLEALRVLVQATQGPCPENQEFIAKNKVFAACKVILSIFSIKSLHPSYILNAKILVVKLLSSCLENRHNTNMEETIASRVEISVFDQLHLEFTEAADAMEKKQTAPESAKLSGSRKANSTNKNNNNNNYGNGGDADSGLSSRSNDGDASVKAAVSSRRSNRSSKFVTVSDSSNPLVSFELPVLTANFIQLAIKDLLTVRLRLANKLPKYNPDDMIVTSKAFQESFAKFKKSLASIEIYWKGHIEEVLFPLPKEAVYLSGASRTAFLHVCDLSSPDNRVKELMENRENFFDEMIVYFRLTANLPFYSYLSVYFSYFKSALFTLSLLLNIAIILALPAGIDQINSFYTSAQKPTSAIILILGLIILIGYSMVTFYFMLPLIPIKRRRLERLVANSGVLDSNGNFIDPKNAINNSDNDTSNEKEEEESNSEKDSSDGEKVETRNWNALIIPCLAMLFYMFCCIIHYFSFYNSIGTDHLILIYFYIFIGVFGIWFLFVTREVILVPVNKVEFYLCLFIDTLSDFNMVSSVFFVCMTIVGLFKYVYLFTLLLLDFMMLSEYAQNVVRSIVRPWRALMSILIVFLIVIEIFGMYGILNFGSDLFMSPAGQVKGNADGLYYIPDAVCHSMMSCLGVIFYGGLRSSDIASVMDDTGPDNPKFAERIFFDVMFFVVLGVLLFNMVTGIIVDTFASLREETEEREMILSTETFVSGLGKDQLEEKGIKFDDIQDQKQHVWNYIYYIFYLQNKPFAEYNGLEKYIFDCVNSSDYVWFPKKTCAQLWRKEGFTAEHEAETPVSAIDDNKLNELKTYMDNKLKHLEEMIKKISTK